MESTVPLSSEYKSASVNAGPISVSAHPPVSSAVEFAPVDVSDGVDILDDLLLPLLAAKRPLAWWTAVFLVLGLSIAMLLKPVFTASAVIMPPQQQQSAASALIGQLGSLGSLGGSSGIGIKNPADMYVGILKSRVIADSLIDRFQLQGVYKVNLREEARKRLAQNTEFEAAKDGLIYIRVKDHDPQRSAGLANGYVDELHRMNSRLAIGEASQRRLFFDQQLTDERKALASAEDSLKATQEKTGMIQLTGQAEMTIRNIASVRAQIATREVQLGVTRTFATDQNPEVARLQQEISSLKSQLAILESVQRTMTPGDIQLPAGQVPEAGLEYLRKLREVRYHESLFELLAKQQEAASLDEAKSAPLIQVVDSAEVPELRSGPSRLLIVLEFAAAGFVLRALGALFKRLYDTMSGSSKQTDRLNQIQRILKS